LASEPQINKAASGFLAAELDRLMALPLDTIEDTKRWDIECARVQTELEIRFPCFEIEHHVHHFFADSDIRQQDLGYRQRQHQAISDYIRQLLS